jgi:Carboxypeptidase regulatory-like domain
MHLRKLSYCVFLLLLALAIGCGKKESTDETATSSAPKAAATGGNAYDASKATATITGKINFDGAKPTLAPLQMGADPVCMKAHPTPVLERTVELNADGTLKDAFIYIKKGAEKWTFTSPTEPVELDQEGCLYHPHIVALMVNQPLKIVNSDPTLHNIHPMPKNNPEFNLGQPSKGMSTTKVFPNAEQMIPVKCDVHRWMQAYIAVMPNPFFSVSNDQGTYSIKVPPGTYTIEAWHEKYGTQTQDVTVTDNETKEVPFTFKATM